MSAAVAALFGALIGAAASVIAMIIQQRYQNKRELLRIAADVALEDYKRRLDLLGPNQAMPPLSAYVHYQLRVMEHMAGNRFTPETIKVLSEEYDRVLDAYRAGTDARVTAKRTQADASQKT